MSPCEGWAQGRRVNRGGFSFGTFPIYLFKFQINVSDNISKNYDCYVIETALRVFVVIRYVRKIKLCSAAPTSRKPSIAVGVTVRH